MEKVLNLYKPRGETPLQTLEKFQTAHPEYTAEKMTYAGRLDPMAEGVLLALVGEETKNREVYTDLPKEYVFEFILGLETDTYDLLGLPKAPKVANVFFENSPRSDGSSNSSKNTFATSSLIKDYIENKNGKFSQKYPPFSSKVVGGKSLFSLAKAGRIFEKDLPSHEVEIFSAEYLGERNLDKKILEDFIRETVSSVDGDFRQKQIMTDWKKVFSESERETYVIHKARISVSSGFYVRQFVRDIGEHFKTGAVTFAIARTRVGKYAIKDSVRVG